MTKLGTYHRHISLFFVIDLIDFICCFFSNIITSFQFRKVNKTNENESQIPSNQKTTKRKKNKQYNTCSKMKTQRVDKKRKR